jgi:hypothetical protein
MRRDYAWLLAAALLLAGMSPACSPGAGFGVPDATTRTVTPSDIIGRWQYRANPREAGGVPEDDGVVTIAFAASGAFEQLIVPPPSTRASTIVQKGTWALKGSSLELSGLLMWETGFPSTHPPSAPHWIARDKTWIIIDSVQRPGNVAIYGGAKQDPDFDDELDRLP